MTQTDTSKDVIKYVVFDFDGTLANTMDAILDIATNEVGEISDEDYEAMRHEGIKGVIKRFNIPLWELPKVIAQFSSVLTKREDIKLYPHIIELMDKLTANSFKLGVLSSNSEENIKKVLDRHSILEKFDFIYSQSSLFGKDKVMKRMCKKHNILPSEIIYVGDEDRDINACKKVNIKCIAVTYGFNSRERLAKLEPDFIADATMEIADIVLSLNK